jgi:NADH dehydrogenase FAD-containing subunit
VAVKLETKVQSHTVLPSGQTELTLSDGSKMTCDLYLPTTGLIPNNSYIPTSLLDQNGYVLVDEFLHVKGTNDAWAVGDISSVQRPQFINTDKQSTAVAKNIGLVLKGQTPVKFATGGGGMSYSLLYALPLKRQDKC